MNLDDVVEKKKALRNILENQGIAAVLAFLNNLTTHRFTALYKFDNDVLKNRYFYDRTNPVATECPDIPIEASYCIFLKNTGEKFVTDNSFDDDRVIEHPKRLQVRSYIGYPLVSVSGEMFGSICHFDFDPQPADGGIIELMEVLAYWLSEERYLSQL